MAQIGVSDAKDRAAAGGLQPEIDVTGLKFEEEIQVRIVAGVELATRVFYPILSVNAENQIVPSWNVLIVGKDSLPEALAIADQRIQMEKTGEEASKCESRLKPQTLRLYTCLDRREPAPTLKKLTCNWTTYSAISALQKKVSKKDASFLHHGLIFMFDIFIKKTTKDSNRPAGQYNTTYKVEAISDVDNPFYSKIPVSAIPDDSAMRASIAKNLLALKVFTQEELDVINASSIDLEAEARPLTPEEVMKQFTEKPIFLGAQDAKRQQPVFPFPTELAAECKRLGIPYVMSIEDFKKLGNSAASSASSSAAAPKEDVPPAKQSGEISIEELMGNG